MVDNVNPTSQFHPYQPPDAKPQTEIQDGGILGGVLNRFGIDQSKIGALGSTDLRGQLTKARTYARDHGGMLLGGLAAIAIGAGLMRRRSLR